MSNNQIIVGNNELSEQEVQTLRQTIASELNEPQFNLFLAMCQKTGANPIVNEIHPSVFKGQMTVQFGYDFYIRKAKETEGYQGFDVQLIHENDEFKLGRKRDDETGKSYLVVEQHDITFPRGKVVGGYAIAYRAGVPPITVPMEVEEVEHLKKSNIGMQRTMWNNYFSDMFKKHILKRALKMQFGLEFDENPIATSSSEVPEYEPRQRKDITPNQDVIEPAEQEQPQSTPVEDDEETKLKKAREEMKKKFKQLGITDKAEMTQYIQEHCEIKGDKPTLAELTGLLKIMDMHIEEMNENQSSASDDDLLE